MTQRLVRQQPDAAAEEADRSDTSGEPWSGDRRTPPSLTVMAEYGVVDPVWARPDGHGEPVDLTALGAPATLVTALRAWNAVYESLAVTDFVWRAAQTEQEWTAEGSRLAASLQRALPDTQVWFWHDGTARLAGKTG